MDDNKAVDNINYKSICCTGIPELFLDKLVAKKHFSKFGKINRFILHPKRLSCTIEYESEDAAERAYLDGGDFNGHEFTINYAVREVAHVQNTEEWVDPDVQAELEAMGLPSSVPMRSVMAAPPIKPLPIRSARVATLPKPAKVDVLPVTPKIDATLRSELEAILRRPAFSDEDKYRVLDARDKLIRLTTVRQTDIKKAVSTRGTCPDMCPEKERLMREFQRQVSSFETEEDSGGPSTISHRRAIKEYSRSSADQEMPLPHELRSESVLQMTMLYLMHRIMDLCDDPQTSIADWFHFVWDRTRSIRKDITQQELCSVGVVQLVEQCARFHIHCAARLVSEEPSVFDKKINAENLTKCLQTLKYMYHDLRIKNEICSNEAEFRSYIILLNLGDANFLWELKQLPSHIQNSPAIKRAVAFYNVLQNNNYVRFFEMIRSPETSYMSACILLSYFNILRLRAMEVIYKAHNWRKNSTMFPLAHLSNLLGFENEQSAMDFFQYHGWQCDDVRVILDNVKRPDMEYSMDRALELVESKRSVSVGESVCGHRLEAATIFENHEPHNSFDSNGYLRSDSWKADDQLRGTAATTNAKYIEEQPNLQRPQQITQQHPLKVTQANDSHPVMTKPANSIFKVPQAALSLHPKQQQQQQRVMSTSIFNEIKPVPSGTDQNEQKTSITNNSEDNSKSLFKTPQVAQATPPTGLFGNSLFKASTQMQSNTTNIFSEAVQETKRLFQPPLAQNQEIISKPPLMHANKIFQTPSTFPTKLIPPLIEIVPNDVKFNNMDQNHQLLEQARLMKKIEQEEEERRIKENQHKLMLYEEEQARLKAKLEEAKRKQALEQLNLTAKKQTDEFLNEIIAAEISALAKAELSKYQRFEKNCREILHQILQDEVQANIIKIANEEYALMCRDQMIICKYLKRWTEYTHKRIQQRELIESLPIWATSDSREQQTEKLRHPSEYHNLQMIKRYRHGLPCNFKLLLWSDSNKDATPIVDIYQVITNHKRGKNYEATVDSIRYFKLIFTLPDETEELHGFESLCHKWLHKYLKIPIKLQENSSAFINNLERKVALCVRKVIGVVPKNELGERVRDECDNSDALILFMSCTNIQNTKRRLHHLLKLSNIRKQIPVAFIVYDAELYDEQQLIDRLELKHLIEDRKISSYKFYGCCESKNQFHFNVHLSRALRFVSQNSTTRSEMEMQSLESWLESSLGEEMWRRWQQSTLENPIFAKLCETPRNIIMLYNEALERLCEIVKGDWQIEPDFPNELRELVPHFEGDLPKGNEYFPPDWQDPVRQERLCNFLRQLKLPQCEKLLPTDVENWELWLLNYASVCLPDNDLIATEAAYEAIKALIEQLNCADMNTDECLPQLNFLFIIKKIAFRLIDYVLQKSPATKKIPREVFYRRHDLKIYYERPWWLNIKPMETITVDLPLVYEKNDDMADLAEQQEKELEEMEDVLHYAEQVSRRAENSILALRQQTANSIVEDPKAIGLRRELDESIYNFELSKKMGTYDISFNDELNEEHNTTQIALPQHSQSVQKIDEQNGHIKKRKHDESNETDMVIAKAFNLIEKLEAQQDQRRRLRLDEHEQLFMSLN